MSLRTPKQPEARPCRAKTTSAGNTSGHERVNEWRTVASQLAIVKCWTAITPSGTYAGWSGSRARHILINDICRAYRAGCSNRACWLWDRSEKIITSLDLLCGFFFSAFLFGFVDFWIVFSMWYNGLFSAEIVNGKKAGV